jgi:hypothetical protein
MLSGCTTSATDAGPSSTPIDEFAWQQELLQEHADELWNRVEREFPDATRPEAEFIEWSTMAGSGGTDRLIDCLNEESMSPPEENTLAVYLCMVQYPEKPEFPTQEADPKP